MRIMRKQDQDDGGNEYFHVLLRTAAKLYEMAKEQDPGICGCFVYKLLIRTY